MNRNALVGHSAAAVVVLQMAIGGVTASAQLADSPIVRITDFRPPSGALQPGDTVASQLTVFNPVPWARRIWVGYSVEDPNGEWFDVPAHAITLGPLAESMQIKRWVIPADPPAAPGAYRVVLAIWSSAPERAGAQRLASADKPAAFTLRWKGSLMDAPEGLWRAAGHRVGRGRMRPDHVLVSGEGFRLRLPRESCDGAEVRTIKRYHYGEYAARIRVPDAPGSLSALFLYESVSDDNDEIDIEIYNDGSRRALLSAWRDGKMTRSALVILRFDPAAGYHDYTIRWWQRELIFLADGIRLARWTSGYPRRPMRVMANVWWPTWLSCVPVRAVRELSLDSIRLSPNAPPR